MLVLKEMMTYLKNIMAPEITREITNSFGDTVVEIKAEERKLSKEFLRPMEKDMRAVTAGQERLVEQVNKHTAQLDADYEHQQDVNWWIKDLYSRMGTNPPPLLPQNQHMQMTSEEAPQIQDMMGGMTTDNGTTYPYHHEITIEAEVHDGEEDEDKSSQDHSKKQYEESHLYIKEQSHLPSITFSRETYSPTTCQKRRPGPHPGNPLSETEDEKEDETVKMIPLQSLSSRSHLSLFHQESFTVGREMSPPSQMLPPTHEPKTMKNKEQATPETAPAPWNVVKNIPIIHKNIESRTLTEKERHNASLRPKILPKRCFLFILEAKDRLPYYKLFDKLVNFTTKRNYIQQFMSVNCKHASKKCMSTIHHHIVGLVEPSASCKIEQLQIL